LNHFFGHTWDEDDELQRSERVDTTVNLLAAMADIALNGQLHEFPDFSQRIAELLSEFGPWSEETLDYFMPLRRKLQIEKVRLHHLGVLNETERQKLAVLRSLENRLSFRINMGLNPPLDWDMILKGQRIESSPRPQSRFEQWFVPARP